MSTLIDQYFIALANGVDPMAAMSQQPDPAMMSVMQFLMPSYPWHGSQCGDLDLTGYRKPQSYYRDILWNGGDRVYATVRLPEPEGKKIVAVGWAVYPTVASWNWPGHEGKELQVEVYSGAEKVRLFLNDKLIGEQPTGREQQFKALFTVPYAPGILKAVGVRGDRGVAESVLITASKPTRLRLTADRTVLQADGQDLSFITVEALDAEGRFQPDVDQEVQFAISGPGVIAAVGNADGKDSASYQADRRRLFQGRALVVVRTSHKTGLIHLTAAAPGLHEGVVDIQSKTANQALELR
jgi:beta-galactosidase